MKKWRNKITGEINEFMVHKRIEDSEDGNPVYASFNGCIDEWEDYYEEPKEYWYVDSNGNVNSCIRDYVFDESAKEIGNYFETKEEAEKAVEKLKAWKRLRDKGFKFKRWEIIDGRIDFMILPKGEYREKVYDDLDLLFGGEE